GHPNGSASPDSSYATGERSRIPPFPANLKDRSRGQYPHFGRGNWPPWPIGRDRSRLSSQSRSFSLSPLRAGPHGSGGGLTKYGPPSPMAAGAAAIAAMAHMPPSLT